MVQTIPASELSARLRAVLESTRETSEPVLIEDNGETVAVFVSPESYEQYRRWKAERVQQGWDTVDRIRERNADQDPDELLAFVTEVVEEVRQEHYERERAAARSPVPGRD